MSEEVFAQRVRAALTGLIDKPPFFLTRSAERLTRWVNRQDNLTRSRIRGMSPDELRAGLERFFDQQGLILRELASENGELVRYTPGGDSEYDGLVTRMELVQAVGYSDVFAPTEPTTRQRVWSGQSPTSLEPDEVLLKATDAKALHDWAKAEGFGDWEGTTWVWWIPADEGIPIIITGAVLDAEGNVVTEPVFSDEYHANIRVL